MQSEILPNAVKGAFPGGWGASDDSEGAHTTGDPRSETGQLLRDKEDISTPTGGTRTQDRTGKNREGTGGAGAGDGRSGHTAQQDAAPRQGQAAD